MTACRTTGIALLLALLPACALAGPEGSYDVVGRNPDDNGEYRGTVTVKRTGETYEVLWEVAGTRFIGVGIGGVPGGTVTAHGAARDDDSVITVGYGDGNGYGIAHFDLQPDGVWKGVWTYAGSERISSEEWLPKGTATTRGAAASTGAQPAGTVKPTGDYLVRP